jgi:adenylate cyclase
MRQKYASEEEEWRAYLDGTHPSFRLGQRAFRLVPWGPRCRLCYVPFHGPGNAILGRFGFQPWAKNPNICSKCITWLSKADVSGAEVELSFLFADVRRSSDLARRVGTMEFTRLMQRFYTVATEVLIEDEAIVEKFVGDEVVGFFLPLMTGPNHAAAAIRAGEDLLRATGLSDEGGDPWLPLGVGVNTGPAFVGVVSSGATSDFTAFGDAINVTAHVAAQAAAGELLVTDAAAAAAGLSIDGLEHRELSLKGHPMRAVVLRTTAPPPDAAAEPSVPSA